MMHSFTASPSQTVIICPPRFVVAFAVDAIVMLHPFTALLSPTLITCAPSFGVAFAGDPTLHFSTTAPPTDTVRDFSFVLLSDTACSQLLSCSCQELLVFSNSNEVTSLVLE
ncbi:hypothetical protein Salat_1826800 [Sesamum alatum]|uniref:Uncharacterized protein n=1 Tax=Sesamum alatum TaxID=300844 RepID=A0AAE1Y3A8_9LAMI|nr:hypothetical protein Salat_1826800 [Sesamum alatum]